MFPFESGDTPSASVVWAVVVALSGDWGPSLLGALVAVVLIAVFRGAGFFFWAVDFFAFSTAIPKEIGWQDEGGGLEC